MKMQGGLSFMSTVPAKPETSVPKTIARPSFYGSSPVKKKPKLDDGDDVEMQTELAPGTEAKEGAEAKDGFEGKRCAASPEKAPAGKKRATVQTVPTGMTRVPNEGNGNCVCLALGQALAAKPDKPKAHRGIRAALVAHLRKHTDRYEPWWDGLRPQKDDEECPNWDTYLRVLAKDGAWAGTLELAAAAAHFDRTIVVFGPHLATPEAYNTSSTKGCVCSWYDRDAGHYEWLKGTLPAKTTPAAANGPMQGGRGGSSESALASVRSWATRVSALPPLCQPTESAATARTRSSAMPPAKTAKVTTVSLPSDCGTGVTAAAISDLLQDEDLNGARDNANHVPAVQPSGQRKARHDWTCPVCQWTTGGAGKYWTQKKQKHIEQWRPELQQQLKIGALPELVPWSADTCSWKCPLCVMGIPKEVTSADRAYRMRVAHAREAHPKAKRSRFRLPRSHAQQQNVQKATRAKVSAGIAQQMLRLKAGSQGEHQAEVVRMPYFGKQKNRRSSTKLLRTRCKGLASNATQMAKLPCDNSGKGGPKRIGLLRRLQALADGLPSSSDDKEHTLTLISKLQPDAASARSASTNGAEHQIMQISIPLKDLGRKFFCTRRRRVASESRAIKGTKCNGVAWSQQRAKLLRLLQDAGKIAKGSKQQQVSDCRSLLTGQANHQQA